VAVTEKKDLIYVSFNTLSDIKALHSVIRRPRVLILALNRCGQPELFKCLSNHSYSSHLEKIIANIYDRVDTYN